MLIDTITLTVKAGNGGNGSVHFRRDGQTSKGGPDGGSGGNGGSVYINGSHNITDLRDLRFRKKITGENGTNGSRQQMDGKNGVDVTFSVPLGTKITDLTTNLVREIDDETTVLCLARGGKGGRGNIAFKSATNQTPREAEKGTPGEEKNLLLELRLIAEIGLIGLPNAGKSTVLSVVTNATPGIGDYPFTTLEPNIGMLTTHPIADIPGLIKGASAGKGLGVSFLRHIEKTKILIHCIDASTSQPVTDYDTIRSEFNKFNPELLNKPEYILLTKTDLVTPRQRDSLIAQFEKRGKTVYTHSIYEDGDTDKLKQILLKLVDGT